MNERRSDAATAVVNGKIFCAGGHERDSVECYDLFSDVWTLVCNMPQNIYAHGAIEIDGNFIIIGGYTIGSRIIPYLKDVWALDTENENVLWIEKPSMFISRMFFSIAKIDDEVFVCGGACPDGRSVEIFDGEVWRSGPKMPTPRWNTPAVVIPMEFARYLN